MSELSSDTSSTTVRQQRSFPSSTSPEVRDHRSSPTPARSPSIHILGRHIRGRLFLNTSATSLTLALKVGGQRPSAALRSDFPQFRILERQFFVHPELNDLWKCDTCACKLRFSSKTSVEKKWAACKTLKSLTKGKRSQKRTMHLQCFH